MTQDIVISAFEACTDFSGTDVCAHCGWLDDEHQAVDGPVELLTLTRAA